MKVSCFIDSEFKYKMDTILWSNVWKVSFLIVFLLRSSDAMITTKSWSISSFSKVNLNLPRPVLGYRSYMDVFPTRFEVPTGLSDIVWLVQTIPSSRECGNMSINFLIQRGGLPLVKQSNASFPANYFVPSTSLLHFEMNIGQAVSFSLLRPPPGPYYIIAYGKDVDNKIRQKGLSQSKGCSVSYVTSLQMGAELQRLQLSLFESHPISVTRPKTLISFTLPASSFGFQVKVLSCHSRNCSISMNYLPFSLYQNHSKDCFNLDSAVCSFIVPSPPLGDEQQILIAPISDSHLKIKIQIIPLTCKHRRDNSCLTLPVLARVNTFQPNFAELGYIFTRSGFLNIQVGQSRTLVIPFEMTEPNDVGATMKWRMRISFFRQEMQRLGQMSVDDLEIHVCGGLVYNHLPDLRDEGFDACTNLTLPVHVSLKGLDRNESIVYVPYPKVGTWHVILQAVCLSGPNGSQVACPTYTSVDMAISMRPCVDNGCGGRGECLARTVGSDLITFTACRCYAGYRGYGCDDDSKALSDSIQLAGAFLLTLSNLFFLPSICIAIRRRFFVEAFIYSYTMFFSTFYHACDGDRIDQYRMCMIKFDVLQSADFFGSSCSLWFTMVAMAMIRISYVTPMLQIVGPFGLFIGIVFEKTSLYVIAVPTVAGLLTIIVSWGFKMYKRRKLYPSKKRYLFFLLPGVSLATVAAVIYSFLETDRNYKYLHSMWHVCLALSVCFLLPPRAFNTSDDSKSETNMTTPLTNIASEVNDAELAE